MGGTDAVREGGREGREDRDNRWEKMCLCFVRREEIMSVFLFAIWNKWRAGNISPREQEDWSAFLLRKDGGGGGGGGVSP